jgi:hypothetical protein
MQSRRRRAFRGAQMDDETKNDLPGRAAELVVFLLGLFFLWAIAKQQGWFWF